ncbi:MAG: phosphoribosylamine--glycine ligase [Burkholderiaceae bacterium]
MKLLVIGGGGREHAIAWALSKSQEVSQVFVAPGNGGTAREPGLTNLAATDFDELISFARAEQIAYTVVGPEAPLAAGIVDAFRAAGLAIFGPTQAAAQLEASKDFAKSFMARHNIPTGHYRTFEHPSPAHAYIDEQGAPIVIKADGLAAGKGVIVALTADEAHQAVDDMLVGNQMGDAGARVVIEEFLAGEEASFIALVDGEHVLALASSQDHKRLLDEDAGPNTGGMGAYSPAPIVTDAMHARIMQEIIEPTVKGMTADGSPFSGFLYAGVMITDDGSPKTLEFNCRMGDPETQPILMRLKSDFHQVMRAAVSGTLNTVSLDWDSRCALGVVMAAERYPASPRTGDAIHGLPQTGNAPSADAMIFHAGTKQDSDAGQTVTSGGRVLCVTALGASVADAQASAYAQVSQLCFDGLQYRRDIGFRAINK